MEVWKDILGFEGLYQVSNKGNVKSVSRTVIDKNGRSIPIKSRVLKPAYRKRGGYGSIVLRKGGKSYPKTLHRLVAQAFIPNPNNYPCVNHIDEDTSNNNASNLEWCTWKYNDNYGLHGKRISMGHSKKVAQYDLNNNLIRVYTNATQASKVVGVDPSQIRACALGKVRKGKHGRQSFKTAGGYKWEYLNTK